MKHRIRLFQQSILFSMLVAIVVSIDGPAQGIRATVTGRAIDFRAVVPKAKVTTTNAGTTETRLWSRPATKAITPFRSSRLAIIY